MHLAPGVRSVQWEPSRLHRCLSLPRGHGTSLRRLGAANALRPRLHLRIPPGYEHQGCSHRYVYRPIDRCTDGRGVLYAKSRTDTPLASEIHAEEYSADAGSHRWLFITQASVSTYFRLTRFGIIYREDILKCPTFRYCTVRGIAVTLQPL